MVAIFVQIMSNFRVMQIRSSTFSEWEVRISHDFFRKVSPQLAVHTAVNGIAVAVFPNAVSVNLRPNSVLIYFFH